MSQESKPTLSRAGFVLICSATVFRLFVTDPYIYAGAGGDNTEDVATRMRAGTRARRHGDPGGHADARGNVDADACQTA